MSLVQRSSLTAVGTRGSFLLDHFHAKWITFTLSKTVEIDPNTLVPEDMKLYEICPEFSPFDTYMSVVAVKDIVDPLTEPYEYALNVLDSNGTGVFAMDNESGYDRIEWVGCPVWQADEKSVFFCARH